MRVLHWLLAFVIAAGVHVTVVAGYSVFGSKKVVGEAAAAGEGGIEVGLGMAGSYADIAERLGEETEEVERPLEETVTESPSEEIKPEPIDAAKAITVLEAPEIIEEPIVSASIYAVPVASAEIKEPKEVVPLDEKRLPKTTEQPVKTVKPSASRAQARASGSATTRTAGGREGNARTYISHLMAWLNRYKHYPKKAKQDKQEGVVHLQFTIDRDGNVLARKIKVSSGNSQLDLAALQMLDEANPLPAVPDDFYPGRPRLPLVMPIEYSLITNKSFRE